MPKKDSFYEKEQYSILRKGLLQCVYLIILMFVLQSMEIYYVLLTVPMWRLFLCVRKINIFWGMKILWKFFGSSQNWTI